jgi:hypothetical protein
MFCNVRRYRVAQAQMDELMHRIDTEFCELVEREPGFVAYEALDCGEGTLITVTTFRNAESADKSASIAASYVRDNLGDFEIERLDAWNGEAKVNRANEEMLQPAHA